MNKKTVGKSEGGAREGRRNGNRAAKGESRQEKESGSGRAEIEGQISVQRGSEGPRACSQRAVESTT